ncbi:hypothetical protein [Desulfatitalea alkaliphila]|uniref:Uncharacterized protein n=1 Tax=Desulfatitalea alkaliphila TaxID=2929485 RepID=A0AA41R8Z9_9BACT|nr:hypothetical protein [Desulfatitalea alkaliphila]MCJ8501053.1 hypothetical protein [Desulfatitalea alkaliphila]
MSEAEQDKRPEPESVETDDELESLSPEEKAAFEKIMAEISAANGGDDEPEKAPDETDALAPAASSSDEIAPSAENETPSLSDEGSAVGEDGLSEDQSDQLDKIMAEIEGKGKGQAGPTAHDDRQKEEENKKNEEEEEKEEEDGSLNEDQQAAMDKIMAEIEGKRKTDHDTDDTDDDAAAEAEEAMSEDQQAALDKIMAEIEGKRKADRDTDDTDDDAAAEAEEAMSEDQQAALDKIMAEIGSKRSREAEGSLDAQADEEEAAAEAAPSQSPNNLSMDEFDDELNNLLQNAESTTASPAKQTPKKAEAPAGFAKDKEINAALKKIVGQTGDETRDETSAAADDHQPEVATDAYPILHEVPADGLQGKAARVPSPRKTSAKSGMRTARRPRRWLRAAMVASTVLAMLSGVGYWGYDRYVKAAPTPSNETAAAPVSAPRETAPAPAPGRQPAEPVAAPVAPNPPALPPPQAAVALKRHAEASFGQLQRELAAVRSDLQNRISDIQQLKSYYAAGIAEEIEKIENALQSDRIPGLEQGLGNTQIELALRAIQRRDNYIAKLDKPLARLSIMSEELLFMERRARIHEILERGIHGLPLDRLRQEARTAMADYEKFSAEISIDTIELPPKPLAALWKEVTAELTKRATRLAQRTPLNRAVSAEICNGNFDRKYMLTALSVETAGCLVRWTGKDLYLNELTELTPEAAEVLTQWPGEWLSLNGIKELSAETARHLAQWPGKRLSLNGLTVLSPEATTELSQWQGDQLEMVGLTRIGRWQNYGTRLYLSEQLKRRLEAQ